MQTTSKKLLAQTQNLIAYEFGQLAHANGTQRVPALCVSLRNMMKDCQVGEGLPLMKAWVKGWDAANLA